MPRSQARRPKKDVTGPVSFMTYRLKEGEIVDATLIPRPQNPLVHLRQIGVRLYRAPDDTFLGRLSIDPLRFTGLEGLLPEPVQQVRISDSESFVFVPPSPLARLMAIPFRRANTFEALQDLIEKQWQKLVEETMKALEQARSLASNARVMAHPWRIEGSVRVHYEDLRLLFSPRGDRACVCGINGRALIVQPEGPRVVIPVPPRMTQSELSALWSQAIAQAEACVAPRSDRSSKEDDALSIDLADQALIASYEEEQAPKRSEPPPAKPRPSVGPTVRVLKGTKLEVTRPPSEVVSLDLDEPVSLSADMSTDFTSADLPT